MGQQQKLRHQIKIYRRLQPLMHRNRLRRHRKTHSSNQWTGASRPAHVFRQVTFVQKHFHVQGPVAHVNSVKKAAASKPIFD